LFVFCFFVVFFLCVFFFIFHNFLVHFVSDDTSRLLWLTGFTIWTVFFLSRFLFTPHRPPSAFFYETPFTPSTIHPHPPPPPVCSQPLLTSCCHNLISCFFFFF
jgi:hypothetical protein